MSSTGIATAIDESITSLRLLDHPYYRAWQNGKLQMRDLKEYAEQYRHFESCLPKVLGHVAAQMGEGDALRRVEANLEDEMTNPRPHLELFDIFSDAVDAVDQVDATKATVELVELYKSAARQGPVPLLAVVAAYEIQGADIAATKAAALTLHYDLGQAGIDFWAVHATVEQQHSDWTIEALETLSSTTEEVRHWARRSARAWWGFLDERDAVRAA